MRVRRCAAGRDAPPACGAFSTSLPCQLCQQRARLQGSSASSRGGQERLLLKLKASLAQRLPLAWDSAACFVHTCLKQTGACRCSLCPHCVQLNCGDLYLAVLSASACVRWRAQRSQVADAEWRFTIQVPLVAGAYERMAFHEAAHGAVAISSRGNLFLQETAPWTAFKKARALYKQQATQLQEHG